MKKRLLCILLSLAMLIGTVSLGALPVSAADTQEPVDYQYYNGTSWETRQCTKYTYLTEHSNLSVWESGWYVMSLSTYFSGRPEIKGDVHLILLNGSSFAGHGLEVAAGNHLTIYAQAPSEDPDVPVGKLLCYGEDFEAGIGGGNHVDGGDVTIYGGYMEISGGRMGAGIGGGNGGDGGNVEIYGGCVKIWGGHPGTTHFIDISAESYFGYEFKDSSGAGIGGGDWGDGGTFKMYGGEVYVHGVNKSAAIGGGNWGDNGTFEFYGGHLSAMANDRSIPAVGAGDGGSTPPSTHTYIDSNLLFTDNTTGELLDFNMTYVDWAHYLEQPAFDITGIRPQGHPVTYQTLDEDGYIEITETTDYRFLSRAETAWTSGYYVMEGTGTIPLAVTVTGDVHLILMNGCELTAAQGIRVENGNTLSIHTQPPEDGVATGKLIAQGQTVQYAPGIGNISSDTGGEIIIHGGDITATGNLGAAGIGGGYGRSACDVVIYGGNVNAVGGTYAAGIGGGYRGKGGQTAIHGGSVTAKGGENAPLAIGNGFIETPVSSDHGEITVNDGLWLFDASGTALSETAFQAQNEEGSVSFYTVEKKDPVSYLSFDTEAGESRTASRTGRQYNYIKITPVILYDGWYALTESLLKDAVTVKGNVHLILCDGCSLSVNNGIRIADGGSLTVYAQSAGESAGELFVHAPTGGAAIDGDFTVEGGNVTVIGGKNVPAVTGDITLKGGTLSISGGDGAAAIDGNGNIRIYGGTLRADAGKGVSRAIGEGDGEISVHGYIMLTDENGDPLEKEETQSYKDVLDGGSIDVYTRQIPVPYLAFDTETEEFASLTCTSYHAVIPSATAWANGWYVVRGEVEIDKAVTVSGDVRLILTDGAVLTVTGGIRVTKGNSLTIYAQSETDTEAGKLLSVGAEHAAGIGGGWESDAGLVTVHGGNIRAFGGDNAAGIGGGEDGNAGNLPNGGFVMHGGHVYARGGMYGAGVGGGKNGDGTSGWGGDVLVTGGTLEAIGGNDDIGGGGGAGIGGGWYGHGESLTITDGLVIARGAVLAAAVGGGRNGAGGILTVSGGFLRAYGGEGGAGIGSGAYGGGAYDEGGEVRLLGGTVYAECGESALSAIGGSAPSTAKGTVTVGEDLTLIDDTTGIGIELPYGKSWIDVLTGKKLALTVVSDTADGTVTYLTDPFGESYVCETYTPVRPDVTEWTTGWYVVDSTLDIGKITVTGDVHLILKDRRTLTVTGGILLTGNNSLTIYAQSSGTAMGSLIVTGGNSSAGIGGGSEQDGGILTVWGGNITATGGMYGAGIGGGWFGNGGTVTVWGGNVTATGTDGGEGIGAGHHGKTGTLAVYNEAVVTANGETVTPIHLHRTELVPTHAASCTKPGLSVAYYVCTGAHGCGKYFADEAAETELSADDVAAYVIPAKGHHFTSGIYIDEEDGTHLQKCTDCVICGAQEAHVNVGGVCVCGYCYHETHTVVYSWRDDFTACRATEKCANCEETFLTENSVAVTFTEDLPSEKCTEWGLGYYEAAFSSLPNGKTESIYPSALGPHADTDSNGFCDHCGNVQLGKYSLVKNDTETLTAGAWLVNDEIELSGVLTVCGDVSLYLADGAVLNATEGILLSSGNTLTVYAQSSGDQMGKIIATGGKGAAGIGGDFFTSDAGTLTVKGGDILATGGMGAAGIGGGFGGNGGTVVISGGKTVAVGGAGSVDLDPSRSAGIGGGWGAASGGSIDLRTGLKMLRATGFRALGAGEAQGDEKQSATVLIGKDLLATANGKPITQAADETEIVVIPDGNKYDGVSLTLADDIYINFYMALSADAAEAGKMEFRIGGRTVAGKLILNENNGRYYAACPLNALEIAETVTAVYTYGEKTYTQEYSVETYLDRILYGTDESGAPYSDEMKTLAAKIANYGYYVQLYLEAIHDNVTVGDGGYTPVSKAEKEYECDVSAALTALEDLFEAPADANGISYYGRTVNFDSATSLNYYVETASGKAPEAYCADKKTEVKHYKDNIYIVSVRDITATELADDFTVLIGGVAYQSSVLDYCGAVIAKEGQTQNATAAIAAFYEYHLAAVAYAASVAQ